MTLLAFETSCDETSVAVARAGEVLSNVVSSQVRLHADYGGVVPELAAREHLRHLIPVTQAALREAAVTAGAIDAVAATQGPGLPSALMVGLKAAQAFAFARRKPFIGIHHHEAHLYSPWIRTAAVPGRSVSETCARAAAGDNRAPVHAETALQPLFSADFEAFQPNVSLIVSGGHTLLVQVEGLLKHRVLGSTVDDAAGECFDKVGKLMGLPYPAGAEIDRLAAQGNPRAFDFPRPMLNEAGDDFSFSGLKTAVRYFLRDHPRLLDDAQQLRDLCAGVQAAIVEVLVTKTIRAARRAGVRCVTASGGVTCNRALRSGLAAACAREGWTLRLAETALCTDNAAMIGLLAERKLAMATAPGDYDAEIAPGWPLARADGARGATALRRK
jgi:N6-L-threonylcarbamoyladenine synthase